MSVDNSPITSRFIGESRFNYAAVLTDFADTLGAALVTEEDDKVKAPPSLL